MKKPQAFQRHLLALGLASLAGLALSACGDDSTNNTGNPDATVADSGVHPDATVTPDSGGQPDATLSPDAGTEPDAGATDSGTPTDAGFPRPPWVTVTHPADMPLTPDIVSDFVFVSNDLGIGATIDGLVAVKMTGDEIGLEPDNYPPWILPASESGAAASALALLPESALPGGRWVAFVPSGQPQVGGITTQPESEVHEALLAEDLSSMFPSGLAAPAVGASADALWVADAVFGPGSVVRAYEYAGWSTSTQKLTEKVERRFTPTIDDVDGDTHADDTTLGKLVFADGGRVGLVSFSFLSPGPAGAAGGVYAFDPATGAELGRIVMPITSTVTGAQEFVGSVRATSDRIIVVSAVKGSSFEDLGGRVAIYKVSSWSPFHVEDSSASLRFDQPEALIHTSTPNPLGLELVGESAALVVDAPFFGDCALDVIDLTHTPATLRQTVPLGQLYVSGMVMPGDPRVSPNRTQAVLGSEAGLVRIALEDRDPPPNVYATHPASSPVSRAIIGDFAFLSDALGVGATAEGLAPLATSGFSLGTTPPGYVPWALTSTGAGAAASMLATVTAPQTGGDPWVVFLPTGAPQVGAIVAQAGGSTPMESVLAEDLASTFPSAIAAPTEGPAATALWVADAVFGPGSVVRAYEYSSWNPTTKKITEKVDRRFTPVDEDFDGDGSDDPTTLGKLTFANHGRVGLVSFTFLGLGGVAGGVYAFDPQTGEQLGRIVLPMTSTGAMEFVGSVRATDDHLVLISAVKGEHYEDIGGRIALYRVTSWSPFVVSDAEPGTRHDQPEMLLETSHANPLGLELVGKTALVLDAPFFAPCALDVFDLGGAVPTLAGTVMLGDLYVTGGVMPGDPRVSPDKSQAFITSEAGLLRVAIEARP